MMKSGMNRDCCDCISFLVFVNDLGVYVMKFQTFSCLSTLKYYELVS
ncbi:unnamed protein product [Brassica rapa subsp. trilocularis]